jgi:C2H2 transcription facotor
MYASGSRTPGRRLSVPSAGGNPFQSPHGANVRGPLFGPGQVNASNSGAYSPGQNSQLASPTSSTATWSRRDSVSSTADEAWRRRTWHPDTRDYNGASRLNQVVTQSQVAPDTIPPPIVNPVNVPQQTLRLPGIESFDPIPRRGVSPPRRPPSPMMIDSEPRNPPALLPAADVAAEERRSVHWDMGLHRGLTRLDINTPPRDSAGTWASETNQAIQGQVERTAHLQPSVRFDTEPRVQPPTSVPSSNGPPPTMFGSRHQHTISAPSISTSRETKRHGWYHGPAHPVGETIPEGRPHVDRIVHPNVSAFQGFPAREAQPVIHQQAGPPPDRPRETNVDSMRRLEALVAVATSEGSTAAAY